MAAAEERPLELGVRVVERAVVPVEAAAPLGRAHEERQQDCADERILGRRRSLTCVRAREDLRRRLARELLGGQARVLAPGEAVDARLHELADERAVLVERGPALGGVLLEREGQLHPVGELALEHGEGAEAEAAQGVVEVGRAHGHAAPYDSGARGPLFRVGTAGGSGPGWQPGHQYAVRLASPCPRERIRSPQRGHGRPAWR